MEVIEKIIYYKRGDIFRLHNLGDIHYAIKHCAEAKIKAKVGEVKSDPLSLWLGMGDYAEFIYPSDPRWDNKVIVDEVNKDNIAEDETKWVVNLFEPIVEQGVGLLEGNHEDAIRRHLHVDVQKNISDRLGLPNLGYSAFVRFIFRRENSSESHVVVGFFTHGSGYAITKGAKLNKLQRVMDMFEADIYGVAHMHDIITDTKPYLKIDNQLRIKQLEKVGAVTGSWFKTYAQGVGASYGEKKTYPPTTLGCPIFTIVPDKGILKVEG